MLEGLDKEMKIKKITRINSKIIIFIMLFFVCVQRFIESMGVPHVSIFILDGFNLLLLINLVQNNKIFLIVKKPLGLIHCIVFFIGIIVALLNLVKPMLIIWSLRNFLRFEVFFGACCCFLEENDLKRIFKILEYVFYLNVVVFCTQYVMGYRGDYLGGVFGTTTGANSFCNIFFIIICTYEIVLWFEKKERTIKVVFFIGFALLASALCEMKIFFVEIVVIVIMVFVIICFVEKKYSILIKGMVFAAVGVVGLFFGIQLMIRLYPNFADFFTIEGFLYHTTRASGYSGSGDLNRLTAINTINETLFNESPLLKVFGMGLGATEYSTSISVLVSDFYRKFEYLHYYWLSHAWMYLECGIIGLIGYITGFVFNGFSGLKKIKRSRRNKEDVSFIIVGVVMSFMAIILYFYNQSLRLECAYLLYFCYAIVYVKRKI